MRSSLRNSIIVSVLAALLLPMVALAAGPFYTTNDPAADPAADGLSVSTARKVDDMQELQDACEYFSEQQGGTAGTWVYWHDVSEDQWYRYKLQDSSCSPAGTPTAPPEDGVPVTPPLIIGGLVTLGLLLVGVAWLLRRRGLYSA